MALVLRNELEHGCRKVGRMIETAVKNSKGGCIRTEELDTIFEPFIDEIETRVEALVNEQIDELEGQYQDKKVEREREDIISKRRADILEKVRITRNGKTITRNNGYLADQMLQKCSDDIIYHPAKQTFDQDGCVIDEDGDDIEGLNEDVLMQYDESDDFWDDFIPEIVITSDKPEYQFIDSSDTDILEHIEKNPLSALETSLLLKTLYDKNIPKYTYSLTTASRLALILSKTQSCNRVITCGKRKGAICNRKTKRSGLCSYHLRTK